MTDDELRAKLRANAVALMDAQRAAAGKTVRFLAAIRERFPDAVIHDELPGHDCYVIEGMTPDELFALGAELDAEDADG